MERDNNIDALRLLGAVLVITGHAFALLGHRDRIPMLFGATPQSFGLIIFFSVSGYLITSSWCRTHDLPSYLASRTLRIFPGLIVVVMVTKFVLGPLVTTVSLRHFFAWDGFPGYLWNIALRIRFAMPGVFEHLPTAKTVNGSLWTLPVEFL